MSTLNTNQAVPQTAVGIWQRSLATLGSAGAGALAVVLALAFLPPTSEFASRLLAPALPNAIASGTQGPDAARRHRMADAIPVQHGTYISDPYGCLYMTQYLEGRLELTPILDDRRLPLCPR